MSQIGLVSGKRSISFLPYKDRKADSVLFGKDRIAKSILPGKYKKPNSVLPGKDRIFKSFIINFLRSSTGPLIPLGS